MCENNCPCKVIGCALRKLQGGRQLKGIFKSYFILWFTPLAAVDIPPVLVANGLAENTRTIVRCRP